MTSRSVAKAEALAYIAGYGEAEVLIEPVRARTVQTPVIPQAEDAD